MATSAGALGTGDVGRDAAPAPPPATASVVGRKTNTVLRASFMMIFLLDSTVFS